MTRSARKFQGELACFVPRLKKFWADAMCRGRELANWCQRQGEGWELEVVERAQGSRGFRAQPRRWVVEQRSTWFIPNRRLARDDERCTQASE